MTPANLYMLVQSNLPRQTLYTLRIEYNTFHPPVTWTTSYHNSLYYLTMLNYKTLIVQKSPRSDVFRIRLDTIYRTDDICLPFN